MAQGALGATGVRRVGYGLEVGRSVRAGHIVSPRAQLLYLGRSTASRTWP